MERETDNLWRKVISTRMDVLEEQLQRNTEDTAVIKKNTEEMLDVFTSWKGAMKVFEWIGKAVVPLTAIGTFIAAYFTFGPKK